MNRLQKKCVIASTGLHLLLALILLIGPGFLSGSKTDNVPLLDFVPVKTVDSLLSGGGRPDAKPPAAPVLPTPQPVAPTPVQPVEAKAPAVEPVPKEKPKEVAPPKEEPVSLEPSAKPKTRKPEVSTTLVRRNSNEVRAATSARDNATADQRRRAAAAVNQALNGIEGGLSGSTTIELKGPGGGGVPYANWLQAVNTRYQQAWDTPAGLAEDTPPVVVEITIARDGTVISARISRFSGNSAADQSVQVTLDRVRRVAPLPDDAKEPQRVIRINFISDKASRSI